MWLLRRPGEQDGAVYEANQGALNLYSHSPKPPQLAFLRIIASSFPTPQIHKSETKLHSNV
jgi:hypothetical protein